MFDKVIFLHYNGKCSPPDEGVQQSLRTGGKETILNNSLLDNNEFLRSLLESIPSMLFVVDSDVKILKLNAAASELLGVRQDSLLMKRGGEVLKCVYAGRDLDSCGSAGECAECVIRNSVKRALQGHPVRRETTQMTLVSGNGIKAVHFQITASRFVFDDTPYVLLVIEDVTEFKRSEEKLRQLNELLENQASTDTLTGISNRLKFDDTLETEIKRSQRFGTPLSLIMFDVDRFKSINDTYGHHAGDDVLKAVSKLVAGSIRRYDLFARWGGEEFIIMTPNSDRDHAVVLAEKLRALIESRQFPAAGNLTCSFGVTELVHGESMVRFMQRVDSALYRAKEQGRNRVEKG
jgi:diguanylate cyclase (GGDEF)-like protein